MLYEVWYRNNFLGYAWDYKQAEILATMKYGVYDPDFLFLEEPSEFDELLLR